jgi:hypothetical protein
MWHVSSFVKIYESTEKIHVSFLKLKYEIMPTNNGALKVKTKYTKMKILSRLCVTLPYQL